MNRDEKMGAFVTNKWLVGTLVALVMSMGGYIFKGYDRGQASADSRLTGVESQISELKIQAARVEEQYREIIRRLDRIDGALYEAPRRRPQYP